MGLERREDNAEKQSLGLPRYTKGVPVFLARQGGRPNE